MASENTRSPSTNTPVCPQVSRKQQKTRKEGHTGWDLISVSPEQPLVTSIPIKLLISCSSLAHLSQGLYANRMLTGLPLSPLGGWARPWLDGPRRPTSEVLEKELSTHWRPPTRVGFGRQATGPAQRLYSYFTVLSSRCWCSLHPRHGLSMSQGLSHAILTAVLTHLSS